MAAYDNNTDYQALINAEKAKGSSANSAYLTELESARNAKITDMNNAGTNTGGYAATYNYTGAPTASTSVTGSLANADTGNRNYYNADTSYNSVGSYYDKNIPQAEIDKLNALSQQYATAKSNGDKATMDAAHAQAEAIRAKYGYSGGGDGTEGWQIEKPVTQNDPYNPATLPSASSQESYVNELYAAQRQAALAALKSAYDQNIIDTDALAAKIPATYQSARNATAATNEQEKANWNQFMAANGLNAGTGAQGRLSMSNQLMGDMSAINAQEANAKTDLDTQRLKIQTQYQNDIAQAVANGDLEKARALYNEAVRVDESLVSTARAQADENYRAWAANNSNTDNYNQRMQQYAETLAAYGDFSGYKAMGYTDEQIANMSAYWKLLSSGGGSGGSGGGSDGGRSPTSEFGGTPDRTNVTREEGKGAEWIAVAGYGRLTWGELESLVNQGKIIEYYNSDTGKYSYRKAR